MRPQQERIGLDDVDLGLQERGADLQQWLRAFAEFHADQVAFDHRQAGALENLAALLGMAEQEPHEGALRRIDDRQRHDADLAALESPHDFQELSYPVLQEHGELPNRGVVATARGRDRGTRAFSKIHEHAFNTKFVRDGLKNSLPLATIQPLW